MRGMASAVLALESVVLFLSTPVMINVSGVDRVTAVVAGLGLAVAALVGPAMRYLTGATIPLDGGQAYFG